jgi:hypothetical protein
MTMKMVKTMKRRTNEKACRLYNARLNPEGYAPKNWLTALLLCLFLGVIGVHRFYVGKIGTGILQLLTLGGFGIWVLIDLILICCGKFTDKNGYLLER